MTYLLVIREELWAYIRYGVCCGLNRRRNSRYRLKVCCCRYWVYNHLRLFASFGDFSGCSCCCWCCCRWTFLLSLLLVAISCFDNFDAVLSSQSVELWPPGLSLEIVTLRSIVWSYMSKKCAYSLNMKQLSSCGQLCSFVRSLLVLFGRPAGTRKVAARPELFKWGWLSFRSFASLTILMVREPPPKNPAFFTPYSILSLILEL